MASYKIDQAQRDRLDEMVLGALRPEMSPIAEIVDRVKAAMSATREQWAIAYSRDRTFIDQVTNALRRLRQRKLVVRGTNPRLAEWQRLQLPTRYQMIDALVAQVGDWDPATLLQHARDAVRRDLEAQSDDEIDVQWRGATE